MNQSPAIEATGVAKTYGATQALRGVSLTVSSGELFGLVGPDGAGKTTFLRILAGLLTLSGGKVCIDGIDVAKDPAHVKERIGYMSQRFSLSETLTVAENTQVPLREFYPKLDQALLDEIAAFKVVMSGLPADAGPKYPAELSGGMRKRAGLARALALDPELLFLDEPTAGLDPIGAAAFDELIASLQKTMGLTVFLITHDLDTLYAICDRVAVLADQKVIAVGTIDELLALDHPWIEEYFKGPRGRAATATLERNQQAEAAAGAKRAGLGANN